MQSCIMSRGLNKEGTDISFVIVDFRETGGLGWLGVYSEGSFTDHKPKTFGAMQRFPMAKQIS
jgi:hypothetical protein